MLYEQNLQHLQNLSILKSAKTLRKFTAVVKMVIKMTNLYSQNTLS